MSFRSYGCLSSAIGRETHAKYRAVWRSVGGITILLLLNRVGEVYIIFILMFTAGFRSQINTPRKQSIVATVFASLNND